MELGIEERTIPWNARQIILMNRKNHVVIGHQSLPRLRREACPTDAWYQISEAWILAVGRYKRE